MLMQNPLKCLPTSLTKNTASLADAEKHLQIMMEDKIFWSKTYKVPNAIKCSTQ
jgi:hypothetical protein